MLGEQPRHARPLAADPADPGSAPVGHELVGTSISSSFPEGLDLIFNQIVASLPNAVYANASKRGYVTVELTDTNAVARWRVVETIDEPTSPVSTDFTWNFDALDTGPLPACPVAPVDPETTTTTSTTDPTGSTAGPDVDGGALPVAAPAVPVSASPRYVG